MKPNPNVINGIFDLKTWLITEGQPGKKTGSKIPVFI